MDFLDKLSKVGKTVASKTTQAAKTAADKTGDMIEIGKLNSKISSEKSNIIGIKQKIGEYYWIKFLAGDQLEDEVSQMCADIRKCEDTIAGYEAQKTAIKAGEDVPVEAESCLKCPECGAEINSDVNFCPACGAKL